MSLPKWDQQDLVCEPAVPKAEANGGDSDSVHVTSVRRSASAATQPRPPPPVARRSPRLSASTATPKAPSSSSSSSIIRRSLSARTAPMSSPSPLMRRLQIGIRGSAKSGTSEKSLHHYLTREVLPHLDHYRNRMSFEQGWYQRLVCIFRVRPIVTHPFIHQAIRTVLGQRWTSY